MTAVLLFLALFLFPLATAWSAEAMQYTGAALRDPFAERVEKKVVADPAAVAEGRVRSLVVQGIVASPANPLVIINGKIYRVGAEAAPGIKIKTIDTNGVLVTVGEKDILLTQQSRIKKEKNL